jgi:hypothetical protein
MVNMENAQSLKSVSTHPLGHLQTRGGARGVDKGHCNGPHDVSPINTDCAAHLQAPAGSGDRESSVPVRVLAKTAIAEENNSPSRMDVARWATTAPPWINEKKMKVESGCS